MSAVAISEAVASEIYISDVDREFFNENGYLRVNGAVDPEICDNIVKYIWTLLPGRFRRDDRGTWSGRIQDCCTNLPLYQTKGLVRFKDKHGFAKIPEIRDGIYGNQQLSNIITGALGRPLERIRVRGLHPNFPMPPWIALNEVLGNRLHSQMSGPAWQFPKVPRPPQIPITPHLDAHPFEMSSMLYLDDVLDEAGGLAVWPGSHRLFSHAFESEFNFLPTQAYKRLLSLLQRYRAKIISGKKGDLILFHNRLLHSNTVNYSDRIRYGLLIDIFGERWSEKGDAWRRGQDEDVRSRLCSKTEFRDVELLRSIVDRYEPDARSAFFIDHPRIRSILTGIQQDPTSSFRRKLSAKIRSRAEGDTWLVVSQGSEHKASYKLDAYGSKDQGRYRVDVNDRQVFRSDAGALVEKIDPVPGRNRIRLSGDLKVDHYLRIVRTANPVEKSDILACDVLTGGTTDFEVVFEFPQRSDVDIHDQGQASLTLAAGASG